MGRDVTICAWYKRALDDVLAIPGHQSQPLSNSVDRAPQHMLNSLTMFIVVYLQQRSSGKISTIIEDTNDKPSRQVDRWCVAGHPMVAPYHTPFPLAILLRPFTSSDVTHTCRVRARILSITSIVQASFASYFP